MRPSRSYTLTEALKKLEGYCAYQERCHKEVLAKLRELNMIPEAIDIIVAQLIQTNFLNEERFAKSFARGKFNIKKWGRIRIIGELKHRGISKYNIEIALKEFDEQDYLRTFDDLSKKRLTTLKKENPQMMRKKLGDYLLYRGWESELVYDKVKELLG